MRTAASPPGVAGLDVPRAKGSRGPSLRAALPGPGDRSKGHEEPEIAVTLTCGAAGGTTHSHHGPTGECISQAAGNFLIFLTRRWLDAQD